LISLKTVPVPDRPEVPDHVADRREIGFCGIEIGRFSPDQQGQFPAGRRLRQAGDGTIDIDQGAAAQFARHVECVLMRNRRAFDREAARLHRCRRAVLAEPDGTRRRVVGDHGHDCLGAIGSVRRRRGPPRAARDQVFCLGLAAIPHRNVKTCIEIAAGHAMAHAP